MAQEHHDEVDLVYVIKKIKELIKGWIVLLFKAIDFALKFWFIILALIIIGFGWGYYKKQDKVLGKKSTVVVRVNYDLQPYVFNAIELYNAKAKAYDSVFLRSMNYSIYNPQVHEVVIEPIVDFKDILEDYQINERGLDMLLNRLEFTEEQSLGEIFEKEYSYFYFDMSLSGYATQEDILKLFDYLNQDPRLTIYKKEAQSSLEMQISESKKSLDLINGVFESYISSSGAGGSSAEEGVNLTNLFDAKLIMQDRYETLKNELTVSGDIVVPMQEPQLRDRESRLMHKTHIIYPILMVFGFLLVAYLRYVYLYLKNIAVNNRRD